MYGTSTAGEPGELLKMGYGEDWGFPDVPGNQDSIAEKTALHWEPAFKIFGPHDSSQFLVTNGFCLVPGIVRKIAVH